MKATISITLDHKLVDKAKKRNINLSGLINQLLGDYLRTGDQVQKLIDERQRTEQTLRTIDMKIQTLKKVREERALEEKREQAQRNKERANKLRVQLTRLVARREKGTAGDGEALPKDAMKRLDARISEIRAELAEMGMIK